MAEPASAGRLTRICVAAAVQAAAIAKRYQLPNDLRQDLYQEALLAVWRMQDAFEPGRGSWRTFAEYVITNRLRSIARQMRRQKVWFSLAPIGNAFSLVAPARDDDVRLDVQVVLARMAVGDRRVALALAHNSAVEASRKLDISRAAIYRSMHRIRTAFEAAGYRWMRNQTASSE